MVLTSMVDALASYPSVEEMLLDLMTPLSNDGQASTPFARDTGVPPRHPPAAAADDDEGAVISGRADPAGRGATAAAAAGVGPRVAASASPLDKGYPTSGGGQEEIRGDDAHLPSPSSHQSHDCFVTSSPATDWVGIGVSSPTAQEQLVEGGQLGLDWGEWPPGCSLMKLMMMEEELPAAGDHPAPKPHIPSPHPSIPAAPKLDPAGSLPLHLPPHPHPQLQRQQQQPLQLRQPHTQPPSQPPPSLQLHRQPHNQRWQQQQQRPEESVAPFTSAW